MGTIFQRQASGAQEVGAKNQLLRQAIEQYKKALRDNPALEAARYNMVLCQKQLKDQKDDNRQQSPEPKPQPQPQPQKSQQQPLINYSRQAEQQTRQRMQQRQPQRALRKNW